ncbi:hypothetical protein LINPERHAP2_LOCUS1523 [Linum perenne]
MSDHIPSDIVTNILNRVTHVHDLVKWRSVSKQWLSIIDSDDFINRHLQRSEATTSHLGLLIKTLSDDSFFWSNDVSPGGNQLTFRPQPVLDHHSMYSQLMGCCHGLICFCSVGRPSTLFVVNPSTAVIIVGSYTDKNNISKLSYHAEIHCIKTKYCCRDINISDVSLIPDDDAGMGVYACGALHWKGMFGEVVVLDLGSDTFSLVPQPDYDEDDVDQTTSVGVVDCCLCVCVTCPNLKGVDVWCMEDCYGKKGCWSRRYHVKFEWEFSPVSINLVGRSWSNEEGSRILFLLDDCKFWWYNPLCDMVEEAELKYDNIPGMEYSGATEVEFKVAVYCLESLVKVFQNPQKNAMEC